MRLCRYIAPGNAGTACRNDNIDISICDPLFYRFLNIRDFILDDLAIREDMSGGFQPVYQRLPGLVLRDGSALIPSEQQCGL